MLLRWLPVGACWLLKMVLLALPRDWKLVVAVSPLKLLFHWDSGVTGKGLPWRSEGQKGTQKTWTHPITYFQYDHAHQAALFAGGTLCQWAVGTEMCQGVRSSNTAEKSCRKHHSLPPSLSCHAATMTNRNMNGIFPDYCNSHQYWEENCQLV